MVATRPARIWPGLRLPDAGRGRIPPLTGEPGAPPARMGLSIVDFMTGITTAFALTAALLGAVRTGQGRDVDVTLYDVAMHQLTYPATWYLNEGAGHRPPPRCAHPRSSRARCSRPPDGRIFVMCMLPKFWQALCACSMGRQPRRRSALCDMRTAPSIHRDALSGDPRRRVSNAIPRPIGWRCCGAMLPAAPVYDLRAGAGQAHTPRAAA